MPFRIRNPVMSEQVIDPRLGNLARLVRLLGLVGVLLFLASAFTPLPNFLGQRLATPARLEAAEAIVVLGGGLSPDGALDNVSLRRALHGIFLSRRGFAPLLLFSGPAYHGGVAEAAVRAGLARELGIPPAAILTVVDTWNTREEASRITSLLGARGVRKILLVTDSLHMVRARALFERGGLEVLAAPVDGVSLVANRPDERLNLMHKILIEILARVYYRMAGYL